MIKLKRLPEDILQGIERLRASLDREPDVLFAYLFGSLLRDRPGPLADCDIAIYLAEPEQVSYMELFSRVTDALGTDEVDLVILNTAPISIRGRILQRRRILVDRDPFCRHRFESLSMREYHDFMVKEEQFLERRYGLGR
jgi:uncharacterized protein